MDGSDCMPIEQMSFMKVSGLGIVAAYGLLTMSSNLSDASITSMNIKSDFFYEAPEYFNGEETLYSSSTLSKQAVGDIVSFDRVLDFVQKHKRINVNLQITKINRHISSFDFEDEYEEL